MRDKHPDHEFQSCAECKQMIQLHAPPGIPWSKSAAAGQNHQSLAHETESETPVLSYEATGRQQMETGAPDEPEEQMILESEDETANQADSMPEEEHGERSAANEEQNATGADGNASGTADEIESLAAQEECESAKQEDSFYNEMNDLLGYEE
jgi:hypothetical protein